MKKLLPILLLSFSAQASDHSLSTCLDALRPSAAKLGISSEAFTRFTQDLQSDPSVLDALNAQPEFSTPIWDYLAPLLDERRIAQGREMLLTHAETLQAIETRYGVDRYTLVAVWGVESDYGQSTGKRPLLNSLATLSCAGRRQSFFRGEFLALLGLLQRGDLSPENLHGSWAGAFGHTQFMPSTYTRIAVDFDGDNRRDLVNSIPDALASTANYLVRSGWQRGKSWGVEVSLPAGFDAQLAGRTRHHPRAFWQQQGIRHIDNRPITADSIPAALILPAGKNGPAWLVQKNYDAIFSYNAAESYALAIALLSDRLRGAPATRTPWPTDDPGLGRDDCLRLQQLLLARGHDIGEPDGLIGRLTRRAIVQEQIRLEFPAKDGRASEKILAALEQDAAKQPLSPAPATAADQ